MVRFDTGSSILTISVHAQRKVWPGLLIDSDAAVTLSPIPIAIPSFKSIAIAIAILTKVSPIPILTF